MELSNNLQQFVKRSLLELVTNPNFYQCTNTKMDEVKPSPLEKSIKEHGGSFDKGISSLCDSIASNPEIVQTIETLEELQLAADDENCDTIYETETILFNKIIDFTGLFKIRALDMEDYDYFKELFYEHIWSQKTC